MWFATSSVNPLTSTYLLPVASTLFIVTAEKTITDISKMHVAIRTIVQSFCTVF